MSLFPHARPGNAGRKGSKKYTFQSRDRDRWLRRSSAIELETGGRDGAISVLRRIVRRLYVDDRMHPGMDAAFEQVLAFAESF
jgi:hypothetical protein